MEREVLSLPVKCSNCNIGCQWKGELRRLDVRFVFTIKRSIRLDFVTIKMMINKIGWNRIASWRRSWRRICNLLPVRSTILVHYSCIRFRTEKLLCIERKLYFLTYHYSRTTGSHHCVPYYHEFRWWRRGNPSKRKILWQLPYKPLIQVLARGDCWYEITKQH